MPPKNGKAISKKTEKAKDGDAEPGLELEAPKVKKGRGKGMKAEIEKPSDTVPFKEESSDHDTDLPSPTRKKRTPRKTAGLQKFKSESQEGGSDPESDSFENKPKSQKARKKPNDPNAVVK